MRSNVEATFPVATTVTRPNPRGQLRRQPTENKHEPDPNKEDKRPEEKKNMLINIVDTSQQKTAGLLMVHTVDSAKQEDNSTNENVDRENSPKQEHSLSKFQERNEELEDSLPTAITPEIPTTHGKAIVPINSVDEPVILPFRIPPPPFLSVDVDEDFLFTEPLPPPLEFANSFDIVEDPSGSGPTTLAELMKQRKNGALASASFNTSIISNSLESRKHMSLSNCLPASFLPPPEHFDTVTDSGIEEVDSRSSSEHHLETTSTISTVSSISTLSSEGGEALDTCTVYADGQTFLVDKPPVPPKPKMKSLVSKSTALYKDALPEDMDSFVIPPPAPPPPPILAQPGTPTILQPRTSKLWGDVPEVKSPVLSVLGPVLSGPKANVISELNSILQQMNREKTTKPGEILESPPGMKSSNFCTRGTDALSTVSGMRGTSVTFTIRPGATQPMIMQNRPPDLDSRTLGMRRAPSPVCSPSDIMREIQPAPLSAPAASINLVDVFGLPSPQLSGDVFTLNTGRSRSPSPSILQQPMSNKPFATKPVHLWTKLDVGDWLESLNLGEHKETFMDNEIEGTHLPNLQKEDLIDLGVTRVGHRMNIERALKQLLDR